MQHYSPWNAGRAVGERASFSATQVKQIATQLQKQNRLMELALFTLAIDSMLRVSDLLSLQVWNVIKKSAVGQSFTFRQQKTQKPVHVVLTNFTRKSCNAWIRSQNLNRQSYLFPSLRHKYQPVSESWCRDAVKRWAQSIGLPPDDFSMHSLRRSKPQFLYHDCGVDAVTICTLLGHKDISSTLSYLRIAQAKAADTALKYDIFSKNILREQHPEQRIAQAVSQMLLPQLEAKIDDLMTDTLANLTKYQNLGKINLK